MDDKLRELYLAMWKWDAGDPQLIQHFAKVHSYAKLIGSCERLDEKTLFAILEGVFAMTGTHNAEFVSKHTYDAAGAFDAASLNTAANKACGANKKKISMVFMHSDVATGLENLNLIERLKYTDKDGITRPLDLGAWNGKLVVVDDDLPAEDGYFDATSSTAGALKVVASDATTGQINLADVTPYFGSKTLAANEGYYMKASGANVYRATAAVTLPPFSCYLPSAEKRTYFKLEETTGITEIKNEKLKIKNIESGTAIYDLNGRRINQTQRGIYIQGNRKVVIK